MKLILLLTSIFIGGFYAHIQNNRVKPGSNSTVQSLPSKNEEKILKVKSFLEERKSPLASFSAEFVKWADAYRLDPAILLGIAAIESGWGHHYIRSTNNIFAWGHCDSCASGIHFNSISEGIHAVARGLSTKTQYKKFQETKRCKDLAYVYLTGDRQRWCSVIAMVQKEIQ